MKTIISLIALIIQLLLVVGLSQLGLANEAASDIGNA